MAVNVNIVSKERNKVLANVIVHQFSSTSQRGEIIIGNVGIYLRFETPYGESLCGYVMLENLNNKKDDKTIYSCKLSSKKLNMVNQQYICDDSRWRCIYDDSYNENFMLSAFEFDLSVELDTIELKNPFAVLYEDTDLTDFELCAVDGSVKFHCAVLAAASPALRGMLTGKWSEAEKRSLQIQGASKETLQQLKEYLYLSMLPQDPKELLLLASYYLMTDLETKCIKELLCNVTAENSSELMEFALAHKLMGLYYAFLKSVKDGGIVINDKIMEKFNIPT